MKHVFIALLALTLVGTVSAASFNITARDAITANNISNFSAIINYYYGVLNESCYQETANVSTACGALNTGTYNIAAHYLTVTYTKPTGATGAIWQTKEGTSGVATTNNTLPQRCFGASLNSITVRIFSNASAGISRAECYNSTGYETVTNYAGSNGNTTITGDYTRTYDANYATGAAYIPSLSTWASIGSPNGAMVWDEGIYWNISNYTAFPRTLNYNTTNGTILFDNNSILAIENITVSSNSYLSSTYSGYATSANLTANLTPKTLFITIYNETTGLLLNNTNVTLKLSTLDTENTTTTTNGSFTFARIPSNNYTISASATGYSQRTYQIAFTDAANISIYLATGTTNVSFSIVDKDVTTIQIAGATVTMARLINNTWTTVSTVTADITGTAILSYIPLVRYRFTISASNYQTKVFYLDPVQFDSYTIQLQKISTVDNRQDFSKVDIIITPTAFINGNTTVLLFTITSPTGTLTSYTVTAAYPSSTNTSSGTQPQGETLSLGMSISGAASIDAVNVTFSYTTALGTKNFTRTYPIIDAPNTPNVQESGCTKYGMGDFECAGIATGATGLFSTLGFLYAGPVGGGAIALLFIGFFAKIGFLNQFAVIGSILVGFAILAWRSSE